MKIFLTLLNIVLAGLVVWAASGFFKTPASQTVYTVGRDRSKTTENRTRVSAAAPAAISIEEAAGLVTRYNLFNITRCPDAVSGRRGPSTQQMTLIGIYKMGNSRGAIIQQTQQRSRRTTTNTNNAQQPIKQFYTVGEVLSNGYTLASIDDGQVTLSRGGSTMQLQLEKAGRGISTSATTTQTQRRLSTQQLQQFMMMGQMRMMQQMMQQQNRMLQQNRNQQQGQIPSSNRRNSSSSGNSSSSSSRSRSR